MICFCCVLKSHYSFFPFLLLWLLWEPISFSFFSSIISLLLLLFLLSIVSDYQPSRWIFLFVLLPLDFPNFLLAIKDSYFEKRITFPVCSLLKLNWTRVWGIFFKKNEHNIRDVYWIRRVNCAIFINKLLIVLFFLYKKKNSELYIILIETFSIIIVISHLDFVSMDASLYMVCLWQILYSNSKSF